MHAIRYSLLLALTLLCACADESGPAKGDDKPVVGSGHPRLPSITVSGDESNAATLNWQPPMAELQPGDIARAKRSAARALAQGRLYAEAGDAIPIYLALRSLAPTDKEIAGGLDKALLALLKQGDAALRIAGDDADALARAGQIAAVARTLAPANTKTIAYLARVDVAEQMWRLNEAGERALRAARTGGDIETALGTFRGVLALEPGQARALQGLAATESALIRRAEVAAEAHDFDAAANWLRMAAELRPQDNGKPAATIDDAGLRIDATRNARIAALRDDGIKSLASVRGLRSARVMLAEVLRIAKPGDKVAADFRERIDLATHYGLLRPGKAFTDPMANGGRGPEMIVVPHGGFRMGAGDTELAATDAEKPAHYVRFDRGFAVSRRAISVGEFRRFVQATQYRPRATRRGHSISYDERSGNFVRRNGVDWQSDYAGARAADNLPVLHISVRDAEAYAEWLAEQTGRSYRLPSEAEFEYALRAGTQGRYPWGNGVPPANYGNLTGGNDGSPSGRNWNNAFVGYGDGYWGPAPGGSFLPNRWGLFDMGSNISEWVADCWHASYRRAPADGAAWFNPGCRSRVVRGGSWASSPAQARAAWRSASDSDMTNARVGFRVVGGI